MFLSFIKEEFWDGDPICYASTYDNSNKIEYIYVLKDNKILKLYITIDEDLIENSFKILKDN